MELLMKSLPGWLIMAVLLTVVGCGTPKHISRDRLDAVRSLDSDSNAGGGAFDGRLNLLYEKKTKGAADSPLLTVDGIVAFNSTKQRILGYDQVTGHKALQIKKRRGYILDPVISDSLLILVHRSRFGQIQVRNLFTGKVITERTINEIRSGPIIVSESLIIGTVDGILSLSLPDLETEWQKKKQGMVDIPAVAESGVIFYASGNILEAIAADDDHKLWTKECETSVVSDLSLGRYLYTALASNKVIAVDRDNGEIIWEYNMEFPVHGAVAEYDGRIYFGGTDSKIHCLSANDGQPIWDHQTEGIVTAAPIIYGRAVLVGSQDRYFYSLDRLTGQLIDRHQLEGPVTLAAAVDNNLIFVACRKKRLYCFEGK